MKRSYLYITFAFFLPLACLGALLTKYLLHQRKIAYDFQRNIILPIRHTNIKSIKYNSYYFAGQNGHDLYLGNFTAPQHGLVINALTLDTASFKINLNAEQLENPTYCRLYVDSTQFYLYNGVSRQIFTGSTYRWQATTSNIYSPYFNQFIPITDHSYIFRMVSKKTGVNIFRKESAFTPRTENDSALIKQIDGIFCTDGSLHYNRELKRMMYTYYYRNQTLILDTNLRLLGTVKTIDPIDSVRFTVSSNGSAGKTTFSSPKTIVNRSSCSWKNLLFIQSKIIGKNEDELLFKKSTVIDVYNIETHNYLYSFYLRDTQLGPVSQFRVLNDCIIAIVGKSVIKYHIQLPVLQ